MDSIESIWRRGRRDTVSVEKSFPFIIIEVGGTALTGVISQNPWVGVIYFVGLLVALFIGATVTAPVRQRDEARAALTPSTVFVGDRALSNFIKSRDIFTLKEAACIKAGSPITHGELTGPASGYLYDLKKKVLDGEVKARGMADPSLTSALIFRLKNPNFKTFSLNDRDSKALESAEISKAQLIKIGFISEDQQLQSPTVPE